MKTIPTHAGWHVGTVMNVATLTGRVTTTDDSTAGMAGVLSMTHGTTTPGIMTHGTTTHGITDMQDGTAAGMPDGTDGMDGIPTTLGGGDGMTIIILYMAAAEAAQDITAPGVQALTTTAAANTVAPPRHSVPDAASAPA